MHWAVGLLIGMLVMVLGYFLYLYFNKQADSELKEEYAKEYHGQYASKAQQGQHRVQAKHTQHANTNLGRLARLPHVRPAVGVVVPPPQPYVAVPPPSQPPKRAPMDPDQVPKKKWKMKDDVDQTPAVKPPPQEEYNEIRSFEIAELPYVTTESLSIRNCISAELVRAVIPRNEYVVDSTENTFTIDSATNAGDPVTITITPGDYNITQLVSAIQTEVQGSSYSSAPGAFTAAYSATTGKVTFSNSTPEQFDIVMNAQLAYSLGFTDTTFSSALVSGAHTYTGSNKVDLFGARTVQIKTTELGGPDGHYKDILQEIHLDSDLTQWENTLDPRWTERRFRQPRHIGYLNISIMTRHPSSTSDADYTQLALNGAKAKLTICFRCLRYTHDGIQDTTLELS